MVPRLHLILVSPRERRQEAEAATVGFAGPEIFRVAARNGSTGSVGDCIKRIKARLH